MPASVLFVCLGNICRSPAAEGVLQRLIQERGLDDEIKVDSAGTSSFHIGEPADRRMRVAATGRGYDLTSRSRQATARDYAKFDLIIAMDRNNYRELATLFGEPSTKLRMFSEFLDDGPRDIPDPYHGEADGFQIVLDLLEQACPKILDRLVEISQAKTR
ncbi:MAG: low molecular weight phosphotyrosine protein phosphatase [Pirellulaceae bacterium]|nr:low molecular weight phosphotyrosine protein phosphatase [Pirellulaceae bacterium]